jgi:hypothetical protein
MEHPTAQIAGWEHTRVQDEVIDKHGLPFSTELFADSIPAVVSQVIADKIGNAIVPLDQISASHARSYEVGSADQVTAVWADRHGNRYTSLSLKGNNFADPGITRSATAPSGFLPYGLQEDDALLRVVTSSRLLRENGIPTEWLVSVVEPSVLPYGTELLSQHEYKKKLLASTLGAWTVTEVAEIAEAIAPMTFFVTARCMEINDRPVDFIQDKTDEDTRRRLQKIFTVYKTLHQQDSDYRDLHAESDEDCLYYFSQLLPRMQGTNLARLHNMKLVHKFPVPGNTTALGGIIDLDSIHGEPLGIGDAPITFDDIRRDLKQVFDASYNSYSDVLGHVDSTTTILNHHEYEVLQQMRQNFLDAYFAASSEVYDPKDAFIMFTDTFKVEKNIFFSRGVSQYVHELCGEMEGGWDETAQAVQLLMQQCRERRTEFIAAYTVQALDYALARRHEDPEAHEVNKDSLTQMMGHALIRLEDDAIQDALSAVGSQRLPDFEALLRRSGISRDTEPNAVSMLAHAFILPLTYYGDYDDWKSDQELATLITDKLKDAKSYYPGEYTTLILDIDPPESNDASDGSSRADTYERTRYYKLFPFNLVASISRQRLLESIAHEDSDTIIEIHYDSDASDTKLDDAVRALPVTQYVTDAYIAFADKHVDEKGEYRCDIKGLGEMSYVAAVTAADENGVFHICIREQTGED